MQKPRVFDQNSEYSEVTQIKSNYWFFMNLLSRTNRDGTLVLCICWLCSWYLLKAWDLTDLLDRLVVSFKCVENFLGPFEREKSRFFDQNSEYSEVTQIKSNYGFFMTLLSRTNGGGTLVISIRWLCNSYLLKAWYLADLLDTLVVSFKCVENFLGPFERKKPDFFDQNSDFFDQNSEYSEVTQIKSNYWFFMNLLSRTNGDGPLVLCTCWLCSWYLLKAWDLTDLLK